MHSTLEGKTFCFLLFAHLLEIKKKLPLKRHQVGLELWLHSHFQISPDIFKCNFLFYNYYFQYICKKKTKTLGYGLSCVEFWGINELIESILEKGCNRTKMGGKWSTVNHLWTHTVPLNYYTSKQVQLYWSHWCNNVKSARKRLQVTDWYFKGY